MKKKKPNRNLISTRGAIFLLSILIVHTLKGRWIHLTFSFVERIDKNSETSSSKSASSAVSFVSILIRCDLQIFFHEYNLNFFP